MLGTFSFELYFKSYRWFTEWSLEFLEISFGSFSPSSSSSALSHRRPTVPRRPPPLWASRRPTPVLPPLHASSLDPWTHYPLALELLPFATPPPKLRAAATATPPWPEPLQHQGPQFACASEPRAPHPSFSPTCLASRRSGSPEQRRRPA